MVQPRGLVGRWIGPPNVGAARDFFGKKTLIPTDDGRELQATVVNTTPGLRRGAILLHMAGGNRNDYKHLQENLLKRGIASIAINFRGNRGSGTEKDRKLYKGKHYPHYQTFWKDAVAARNYMVGQMGIPDRCIVVVGGSVGSSTALKYGAMNQAIPAVVLLSPGLTYFDIDSKEDMRKFGNRPMFMMYALQAKGEKNSAETLREMHPDPSRVELHEVDGGFWEAHATLAFDYDPPMVNKVANFVDKHNVRCRTTRGIFPL